MAKFRRGLTRRMVRRGRPPLVRIGTRFKRKSRIPRSITGGLKQVRRFRFHIEPLTLICDAGGTEPPSNGHSTPGLPSTYQTYGFRANSLYEPDTSSTVKSVRGFNEYMSMFEHYTVIGSKIHLRFTNDPKQGESGSAIVGCRLYSTDTQRPVILRDLSESRSRKIRYVDSQKTEASISMAFSTRKFFSEAHPLSEANLAGSQTTNPFEVGVYQVYVRQQDDGIGKCDIIFTGYIDFIAVLHEPKLVEFSNH